MPAVLITACNLTVGGHCFGESGLQRGWIGHISDVGSGDTHVRLDLRNRLLDPFTISIEANDAPALEGEQDAGSTPDSGARPDDHCAFACG